MAKFKASNGEVTKEMTDDLKEKVAILEAILGDQPYLAGDQVTIADISLGVIVPFVKPMLNDSTFSNPKLEAWYERVKEAVPALAELNAEGMKAFQKLFEANK